ARRGLALGDLRLQGIGHRLPAGCGRRGGTPPRRGLGRVRLVVRTDDWRRYAAPAAFLLAVTIAVVLVRSGMNSGKSETTTAVTSVPSRRHAVTTTSKKPSKRAQKQRFWTVQGGDTFGVISSKTGVPVATIARLNPKASSTSLFIGEKI